MENENLTENEKELIEGGKLFWYNDLGEFIKRGEERSVTSFRSRYLFKEYIEKFNPIREKMVKTLSNSTPKTEEWTTLPKEGKGYLTFTTNDLEEKPYRYHKNGKQTKHSVYSLVILELDENPNGKITNVPWDLGLNFKSQRFFLKEYDRISEKYGIDLKGKKFRFESKNGETYKFKLFQVEKEDGTVIDVE